MADGETVYGGCVVYDPDKRNMAIVSVKEADHLAAGAMLMGQRRPPVGVESIWRLYDPMLLSFLLVASAPRDFLDKPLTGPTFRPDAGLLVSLLCRIVHAPWLMLGVAREGMDLRPLPIPAEDPHASIPGAVLEPGKDLFSLIVAASNEHIRPRLRVVTNDLLSMPTLSAAMN